MQKKNGLCEATDEYLPYEVKSLIFKKGSREVFAIPPESTIILDTDKLDSGKKSLSYIITWNGGYKIWSINDYELECNDPTEANRQAGKLTLKMMSLDTQKIKIFPSVTNKKWFDANNVIGLLVPGLLLGVGYYTYKLLQEKKQRKKLYKSKLREDGVELTKKLKTSEEKANSLSGSSDGSAIDQKDSLQFDSFDEETGVRDRDTGIRNDIL